MACIMPLMQITALYTEKFQQQLKNNAIKLNPRSHQCWWASASRTSDDGMNMMTLKSSIEIDYLLTIQRVTIS